MKRFFLIVIVLFCGQIRAADFSWSFLGTPSKKTSQNSEIALFDGNINYNTNHVIWDARYAPKGCGVLFKFDQPTTISRMEVFTAKPNQLQMAPLKTEFFLWDEAHNKWENGACIKDVTGKASDKKFTRSSIKTAWKAPDKPVKALKILMYGAGIWLTEIKLYAKNIGGDEYLLKPHKSVSTSAGDAVVSVSSFGGGSIGNIGFWNVKNTYVGNPNVLNRRDRVVFHFDLSEYLQAGKIKQAILVLPLQPFGVLKGNKIELEYFKTEHAPVFKMDLISNDVLPVATMFIDSKSQVLHNLNVTKMINDALSRGEGSIAFRVRNITIEKVGNRYNKPEGVSIDYKKLKLEIIK